MLFLVSCSSKVESPGRAKLDSAIILYISGRYEKAIEQFDRLKRTLASDGDRQEAYLYLGRCHEALGQYIEAADAYSEGMMIGGDVQFEEHIQKLRPRYEADPEYAQKHEHLTRAQLACLIRGMLLPGATAIPPTQSSILEKTTYARPPDISTHWAKDPIGLLLDLGLLKAMPDSLFHPEARVTKASFFFIVQHIRRLYSLDDVENEDLFPDGFNGILRVQLDALRRERPGNDAYITGWEAVSILNKLKQDWGPPHG
jgi:tetratricopeptide (TPR) repeat protein